MSFMYVKIMLLFLHWNAPLYCSFIPLKCSESSTNILTKELTYTEINFLWFCCLPRTFRFHTFSFHYQMTALGEENNFVLLRWLLPTCRRLLFPLLHAKEIGDVCTQAKVIATYDLNLVLTHYSFVSKKSFRVKPGK